MLLHALKYPFGASHHVIVGAPSHPFRVLSPTWQEFDGKKRCSVDQRACGAGSVSHEFLLYLQLLVQHCLELNAWPAGFPARGDHKCEFQHDLDHCLDYLE